MMAVYAPGVSVARIADSCRSDGCRPVAYEAEGFGEEGGIFLHRFTAVEDV
jgi:hypothetical protein